jgi:hypothetical protein
LPPIADDVFQRCSMLGVEPRPSLLKLSHLVELVRVDPERDLRIGVPELLNEKPRPAGLVSFSAWSIVRGTVALG